MGCGASSVYAKDGTIAAGKGEGKVSCEAEVTTVYIWSEGDSSEKYTLQLRDVPEDPKLLKEAKFKDSATTGPLQPVTTRQKAGLRQSRWVKSTAEGPVAMPYPGFDPLLLPRVIFKAHKADEKKHAENATKSGKKQDKEHPYGKDETKAAKDLEACEKLTSPSQMCDDLNVYKESMATVEDTLTQNQSNTFSSVTMALGLKKEKEGEVELGLPEKAQKIAEEKKNCDGGMRPNLMKAVDGKNQATAGVYAGMVTGAAKALGLAPEDLCSDVAGLVAQSLGVKPGVKPYDKAATFAAKGGELPTPEKLAEEREAATKELLEADKAGGEAAIKEREGSGDFVTAHENKVKAMMEYACAACKPMDEGAIKKGMRVLARWQANGSLYGYYEGSVASEVASGVWFEDAQAKPEPIKKEGKYVRVAFDDGDEAFVPVEGIAEEKTGSAKEEDLTPGTLVRARFYTDCFQDGVIAGPKKKNGTYPVCFDPVFTNDVKIEDIRPAHDMARIAGFPHLLYRQLNDVTFAWIDGRDDLKVEVNVWRELDDDNKKTVELKPVKNKLKDEKGNETDKEVHGGYKCQLELLAGRNYRYNFKVTPKEGEAKFFADFGKEVTDTGSKGFAYNLTC